MSRVVELGGGAAFNEGYCSMAELFPVLNVAPCIVKERP